MGPLICNPLVGTTGRLGNQLWEIASTLGIAAHYDEAVSFPYWEYTEFFNVDADWFVDKGEPVRGRSVYDLPDVQHLGQYAPYLQDFGLFELVQGEIRHLFEPSLLAEKELARPDLQAFWELPEPRLGLHIRRGDNASSHLRGEQGFHPLRPQQYYVNSLRQLDGYCSIAVFSDDLEWCRDSIPVMLDDHHLGDVPVLFFEGGPARSRECDDRYLVEPVRDWVDLLAMATCDRFVLSNSSYSWWAAFLSGVPGSMIRYPDASVWYGPKLRDINASLMFPPDWVPVLHPAG